MNECMKLVEGTSMNHLNIQQYLVIFLNWWYKSKDETIKEEIREAVRVKSGSGSWRMRRCSRVVHFEQGHNMSTGTETREALCIRGQRENMPSELHEGKQWERSGKVGLGKFQVWNGHLKSRPWVEQEGGIDIEGRGEKFSLGLDEAAASAGSTK